MKIDKEKFIFTLTLTKPNYLFESNIGLSQGKPWARIIFDADEIPPGSDRKELWDGSRWRYFAYGETIEEAEQLVMAKWNSKKNS